MSDPFNESKKGFFTFEKNSEYSYLNQPIAKPVEATKVEEKEEEKFTPETYGDYGIKIPDPLNPFKMFDSNEWASNPDSREEAAKKVTENYYSELMKPEATVPAIVDGQLKQVQASEAGRLTKAGLHAYDNSLQLIGMAQQREDGGFRLNPMTGKREFAFGSKNLTPYDPEKDKDSQKRQDDENGYGASDYELSNKEIFGRDHVSSVIDAYAKKNDLDVEDLKPESITPERFIQIRDSLREGDPSGGAFEVTKKINGSNDAVLDEEARKEYADALGYYAKEKQLGDKLVDMYNGQPVINYEKLTDLNKFEEAVNSLPMPAVDKARFLTTFKRDFEQDAARILMEQQLGSSAPELAFAATPVGAVATYAGLMDGENEIQKWAREGNKTAYDFLKENPFYSQDTPYAVSALRRIGLRTVNSFQNTALGASALGLGFVGAVAEKVGAEGVSDLAKEAGMSMIEAGAYSGNVLTAGAKYDGGINEAFSIGDISVTDEDLYSVVGQVLETVVTGGASLLVKGAIKGGTTSLAKMTLKESLEFGAAKASQSIAKKQTAGFATKAAIKAKEAAMSLWTNSSKVKLAENILATSLQGSFGSAGQALSSSYGEAIDKGMSREDALAEATGKATANGLATFAAMSLMNMVAPGVEKILMSPETLVGAGQAIKNTLASRAARKSISAGLTDVIGDKAVRTALSKGVADAVRGQVSKEGIGGYIGAVALNGVSEGLEEMIDTALATTLDAYMNNSPEARKELESGGLWLDVIKSGIMGAMMGSGVNAVSLTSKDKKEMAMKSKDSMNDYLQKKLPMLSPNLQSKVFVSQKDKSQPQMAQTIQQILQTGDLNQKVEALANLGNIAAVNAFAPQTTVTPTGTTVPAATATPAKTTPSQPADVTPDSFDTLAIDASYDAPNGTKWTRKNGQMGEPIMVGTNADGSTSEMTTTEFADFINTQNKAASSNTQSTTTTTEKGATPTETPAAPNSFKLSNKAGVSVEVKTSVKDEKELVGYAYEEAHGKSIVGDKIEPTKTEDVFAKAKEYKVVTYSIDGKPADLHSIEVDNDGNPVTTDYTGETTTKFYNKAGLVNLLSLTKSAHAVINSNNDFTAEAKDVAPKQKVEAKGDKSEKKSESQPEKKQEKKGEAPKAEAPKPSPTKKSNEVTESEIDGEDKLPVKHKGTVKKFTKVLQKLGIKVYVRKNNTELNEFLIENNAEAVDNNAMAATIINGKPAIVINAEQVEKLQDLLTGMKHEVFHTIEIAFRKTAEGKRLYNLINKKKLLQDKKLVEFMQKEYSSKFAELDEVNAFYEVMRAFIAGKLHGETFTYKPFLEYLKAFINHVRKLVKGDKELTNYVDKLSQYYENAVKDADKELGLSVASTGVFKNLMSSIASKAKNLTKSKAKEGKAIQTTTANEGEIDELVNDLLIEINDAYESNANPDDIFNYVVKTIDNRLIGVDVGLDSYSKTKVFEMVLGALNDESSTPELRSLFENKIANLGKEKSPVISLPASQVENMEPVKKRLDLAGWTGIRRFVSGVREDGLTRNQPDIIPLNDDTKLPFTNSFIEIAMDPITKKYPDHDLKFGDAMESLNAAGVVDGYLIYSHSIETFNPETNTGYITHRFMKSPALSPNGKISPFFSVKQSQYAREFYDMVTDSNIIATMFTPTSEGVMITSPEGLIKLVFESLTSNRTKAENGKTPEAFLKQGDKDIKFADIFEFVDKDNKDGTSPFYYKDGKIVVNTAKLARNFRFIKEEALRSKEQKTSVALMVASTVRAAIEEEILHFATIGVFAGDNNPKTGVNKLVEFYDELEKLGYFNDMIDQIREMQGIDNAGASLTNEEKIVIAAEVMSFTHQRATNGATYGDEYQRLYDGMYARGEEGGNALETARQYGQTLNNILQARAATSFMSPKMQEMLEKLNKAKVELGVNQRLNNSDQLAANYLSEQYQLNRGNMQKSIDEAFMNDSFAVEEFRAELREINIPIRQVINIDFEKGTVEINPDFADYYREKYGIDKYDSILSYFSRLNEQNVAKDLAKSVKSARQVMDAMRMSLDVNNELDNLATQLVDGNFDQVINYLENYNQQEGKIIFDPLIQLAQSFEFDDNISLATEKDKVMVKNFYDFATRPNEVLNKPYIGYQPATGPTISPWQTNAISAENAKRRAYYNSGFINLLDQLIPRGGVDYYSDSDSDYINKAIAQLVPQDVIMQGHEAVINELYKVFNNENILPNIKNARSANANKKKQNQLISLLTNKNTSIENHGVLLSYAPFIASVNNYNDLVVNFDEIILNKNLTRVNEFGREFVTLDNLLPESSNGERRLAFGVDFEPNIFGYSNEYPTNVINDRLYVGNMRNKGESEDVIKVTAQWQRSFLGRYTSSDRERYPEKPMTVESNSAYAGEEDYNRYVIGRIAGAPLLISKFDDNGEEFLSNVSYDDYYKTMGFQPIVNNVRIFDGYADPSLLNENLLKFSISNRDIQLTENFSVKMRQLNSDAAIKTFARDKNSSDIAINKITEMLFDGNEAGIRIDDWFNTISSLIGYNKKTGEATVVRNIDGRETFASKFADQMIFRMFGKQDNRSKNLQEYIELLSKAHKALRPEKFKDASKLSLEEKRVIIDELPIFLELVDAANRDIGLGRKAYSRFRSRFLTGTINADIRLIQEQGAEGIRANEELVQSIADSYYDIQAMFDVEWHSNYLTNGGPIGYQGLTALQLMDEFARIPSSATNEFFVKGNMSTKVEYLLDYYNNMQEAYGSVRKKDADGKSGYALDNLIFNPIERPADSPSELDEEFNADITARPSEFTETLNALPQGYEGTVEQLNASRRKDLVEEQKRLKSWATHTALAIFQSIPSTTNSIFTRAITPDRAKSFFYLFAKAQDMGATTEDKRATQSALNALVGEQMTQLSSIYGTSKQEVNPFADIAGKIMNYNHPYEFLMEVAEVIAGKERQFVDEQRALAGTLASSIVPQLRNNVSNELLNNQRSSQEILDSLQEDLDKGELRPGTLFNARMFQLGNANSMLDSSLFMNAPLFSMLLQAMPNLVIYQPAQYTGKTSNVSKNVDIAYLDNGDAVLYIDNAMGLGSSQQQEILEKLLIERIGQERANGVSGLESVINFTAENIRKQIRYAFNITPARIESMVVKAEEALRSIKGMPPEAIKPLVDKYRNSLEAEAIEKMSLLAGHLSSSRFAENAYGLSSIDAKGFFQTILAPEPASAMIMGVKTVVGKPNLFDSLRLVTEMFTNPEAYDVLSKIKAPEADLITDKVNERYEAFIESALNRFQAKEVQSSKVFEIRMDQGGSSLTQMEDDETSVDEMDLTNYADPSYIATFLTQAFEATFNGETTDRSYSKIQQLINRVNGIDSDLIRNMIDKLLLQEATKNTSQRMDYKDVDTVSNILAEADYKPDFMYRYVASELINALSPASDYAGTIEDLNDLPRENSAYNIIKSGSFPLLVDNVGNTKSSSYGNLTNFYYGKSPLTELFERKRKDEFVSLLASETPEAQEVLQKQIDALGRTDATSKTIDLNVFQTENLLFKIRQSIEKFVGSANINQAIANIGRLKQRNEELNNGASKRIADIDKEIKSLQESGLGFVELMVFQNAGKKLTDASEVMDRVASAIASLVADKQMKLQDYSTKISNSLQSNSGGYINDYNQYVTNVYNTDSEIKKLIEFNQETPLDTQYYQDAINKLIARRDTLASLANMQVSLIADSIAKDILSNVVNGAFGLIPPVAEMSALIKSDYMSGMRIWEIGNVDVTSPIPLGAYLSSTFFNKSAKTRTARNLFNPDSVSKMLDGYIASPDLKDRIDSIMSSNNKLFSQLKKDKKLDKVIKKAVTDNINVFDRDLIKKNVATAILNSDVVVESLNNEFSFGFGDLIDNLDNKDADSSLIAESEESIGLHNSARVINLLLAERKQLQKTIKEREEKVSDEKQVFMQLRKKVRFDEAATLQRIDRVGPSFNMLINLVYDPSILDNTTVNQDRKTEAQLQMQIIQEAARLFIEREGEAMYRAINEDVDVFGLGFELDQNIQRVISIADIRNKMERVAKSTYADFADEAFDDEMNSANTKAKQMFGVTVRDMITHNLSPVVITTKDKVVDGATYPMELVNIKVINRNARFATEQDQLKKLALFIEDEYTTSVYMPTTTKLENQPTKTYLTYNQDAQSELKRIKEQSGAKWSVDEQFKGIIFRASLNPGANGKGGLKTQTHKDIDVNLDKPINDKLAAATKVNPNTTVREFIKLAKKNFSGFFIQNTIGEPISDFAQGIGVVGTIKPVNKLKDKDIEDVFADIYSFASDANNKQVLQTSGMEFLSKSKNQYTKDEQKAIIEKAYGIVIKENSFLNPQSKASHALLLNEAQLTDIINMINSEEMVGKYDNFQAYVDEAVDSIGKLFSIDESIANSTAVAPYNLSRAILDLDLSHNYSRLFSVLYASNTMYRLVAGAINPEVSDNMLSNLTVHENALMRRKFSGGIGSYNEALNLVGVIDHGLNGSSGRNRFNAEYQSFQNKMGVASKDLNNDYLNGARAMLIASLKGIKIANKKDGGSEQDYIRKVNQWAYMFKSGYRDYKKIDENKAKFNQNANKLSRITSKLKPIGRKQSREGAATEELYSLLERNINSLASIINLGTLKENDMDAAIAAMISKLEAGLSQDEVSSVNKYSDALLEEFGDIYDAHRIANTFASRDNRVIISEDKLKSETKVSDALGRPYSILPLKTGFVRNPLNTADNEFDESSLSINEFIGFDRSSLNYKGKRSLTAQENVGDPLRPIDLNPFTAVDGLARDAMYRTFLSPTFNVIKKLMGNVEFNENRQMITSHGFLHGVAAVEIGSIKNGEYFPHIASYIMHMVEKNIRNDMPKLIDDGILSDVIKIGNLSTLVRALFSFIQPITNGVLPAFSKFATVRMMNAFSYGNWFGATHKSTEALSSAYKHAIMGYSKPDSAIANFVKENSINSYKWKAEGANIRETQISLAKYHKENRIKYGGRWLAARIRNVGEKSLDITIGGPERANVQAIFTFELFNELQQTMGDKAPKTVDEMFKMNPDDISTLAKTKADIMVSDFMGMSDKAKKAQIYNLDVKRPMLSLITSGLTRFGNHKLTTNANLMVYGKHLFKRATGNKGYDPNITASAVENVAGTLIQNILYHYAKAQVMIPVLTWAAAALTTFVSEFFDEDEPDESKLEVINERYYEWLEAITQATPDGLFLFNWIKEWAFPYMSAYESIDEGIGSGLTGTIGKATQNALWETTGFVPSIGAALGMPAVESVVKVVGSYGFNQIAPVDEEDFMDKVKSDRDRLRQAERAFSTFTSPISEPYEATKDMSAVFLNYMSPKDGYDGISTQEFVYGLLSQSIGTREAKSNQSRRHKEDGGWGGY